MNLDPSEPSAQAVARRQEVLEKGLRAIAAEEEPARIPYENARRVGEEHPTSLGGRLWILDVLGKHVDEHVDPVIRNATGQVEDIESSEAIEKNPVVRRRRSSDERGDLSGF